MDSEVSETPRYVLGAVRAFIIENKREYLINQFQNGIPLHCYPESRDLVEKLLRGEALRGRGQKVVSREIEHRDFSIQITVAQLLGAGLPLIANGESEKPTACSLVAKVHSLTANQVRGIYEKGKKNPYIVSQVQFGREYAETILYGYQITGEIK